MRLPSRPLPEMAARPAEHNLLLACTTASRDDRRAARVLEAVHRDLRWDYVIQLAERHWVMPLLAWHLLPNPGGVIPAWVVAALRCRFRDNASWSLRHTAGLLEVMEALESAGIEAAAWKGPALALTAYGHLGLRAFADLDVLVGANDLEAAASALAGLFQPRPRPPNLTEWPFVRRDGGMILELHWGPAPSVGGAWAPTTLRRERLRVGGKTIPHLAPSDLLVTLCVHGGKHRWERLLWIVDVAELLRRRPDLDWHRVDELAEQRGLRRLVFLGVQLARDLLGAPVPASQLSRIDTEPAVSRLASVVTRHLFEAPKASQGFEYLRSHGFQVTTRERVRDKLRYLLGPVEWRARALRRARKPALRNDPLVAVPPRISV